MSITYGECKFCVYGSIDQSWVDSFGGTLLETDRKFDENKTTTFIENVPDIAAFIGIVNRLADMGYAVVSLEYQQIDL